MSESIHLKFTNWGKYQPRKDHKHPRWFALSNDFPFDIKLLRLSELEKLIFIYLLCETSKQAKGGKCEVVPEMLCRVWNVKKRDLLQTIDKLNELGISTRQVLGKYSESTLHNITEHNRTEQDITEQNRQTEIEPNFSNENSFPEIYDPLFEDWFKTLKPEVIKSWGVTYQDFAWIKQELLKAKTWCISNPSKAPKSNYAKFLTNWLARGFETYRKGIPGQSSNKAEQRSQHNVDAAIEAAKILRERNEQRRNANK